MTDMETGFKVFKSEVIKSVNLKENSFGIETEITIKLAKKNLSFMKLELVTEEDLILKEKNNFKRCFFGQFIVF